MNKAMLKNALIVLLMSIAAFSVFKYSSTFKEKRELFHDLDRKNERVGVLEEEKLNLLQDLEKEKKLKDKITQDKSNLIKSLEASKERLTQLFTELNQAKQGTEQLNSLISQLELQNQELKEKNEKIAQEKERFKATLSSIAELKKAIRDLRVSKIVPKIKKKKEPKAKKRISAGGNGGYLVKDGKSTHQAQVKIEVAPLTAEE
ncbi:MAG: hypothetical protein KJ923_03610 [Candidatus Omnitrophica bacterium]|nr:hypothetical protein [Candidatus Omnitrophota bacterium]